ncbi:hypothetical protein DL766_003898 [Monosporascus sp. MC13-8B]|uniref:Uncharacterized protein n=1 Tax=Monosporascus cannonballus TaxID=155416 RepID=A0ABY0HGI1_9PEZI|nr:hypothetical protein DL762_001409 [Monosporascus cannonballus]RYP00978.1 hypothetical protein DL763_000399 [Monosporascus cannonballus]RYP32573.1 hypothetical protein DL766_003898 [Monosporascus sp. MC13-8B]
MTTSENLEHLLEILRDYEPIVSSRLIRCGWMPRCNRSSYAYDLPEDHEHPRVPWDLRRPGGPDGHADCMIVRPDAPHWGYGITLEGYLPARPAFTRWPSFTRGPSFSRRSALPISPVDVGYLAEILLHGSRFMNFRRQGSSLGTITHNSPRWSWLTVSAIHAVPPIGAISTISTISSVDAISTVGAVSAIPAVSSGNPRISLVLVVSSFTQKRDMASYVKRTHP